VLVVEAGGGQGALHAGQRYLTTMVAAEAALVALGAPVKHLVDKASLADLAVATHLRCKNRA